MDSLRQIPGPAFLVLFPVIVVVAMLATQVLRALFRPAGTTWVPDHPYDLAVVRGGPGALFEAVVARLTQRKLIDVEVEGAGKGKLKCISERRHDLQPEDEIIVDAARGQRLTSQARDVLRGVVRREEALVQAGALMGESTFLTYRLASFAPMALAGFLGGAKVWLGLTHNRPSAFLFFMVAGFILLAQWFWRKATRATRAGNAAVSEAQETNAGLRDAMGTSSIDAWTPNQLALSVALFGFAPLATSSLGYVQSALVPPSVMSGDGSGGSCGSSCGSSCGGGCGGGCGGCGS